MSLGRPTIAGAWPLALALLGWPTAASAAPLPEAGTVETFEYTIVEGDTCAAISKRFYGDSKRYDIIHQYNPGMGPTPHHLEPGRTLRLPRVATARDSGPDAEVTGARRSVEARPASEERWSAAEIGLDLFRGWRVNTLARAWAELTFRDTSVLELRENTLVIIYGATSTTARRSTTRATLDRGALRSRLGELSGGAALAVETPSAEAELQGGRALVTVDEGGTSRVANHGGAKASVRGRGRSRKKVVVAERMGSKVEPSRAPSKPQPLPPPPSWASDTPGGFVAISGRGATVSASWVAEPKAVKYRVELARKPDGRDVVAEAEAGRETTRLELYGLPPGTYYLSVASIDADAFESPPTEPRAITVTGGALLLPDGREAVLPAVADDGTPPPPLQVAAGTVLRAPVGTRCTAAAEADAAEALPLVAAGPSVLHCRGEGGLDAVLALEVVPWSIRAGGAAIETLAIERGASATAVIEIAAGEVTPDTLDVVAPSGYRVEPPRREAAGGWRVVVHADDDAAEGPLVLRTGVAPAAIVLGTITLEPHAGAVAPAPVPAAAAPTRWIERFTPVRGQWELGLWLGAMVPSGNLELFRPRAGAPDQGWTRLRRGAPDLGLRGGWFPLRVFGLELEGGLAPARTIGDRPATLFTVRGHAVARLGLSNVTPFLLAGAGLVGVASKPSALGRDVDASLHVGAGMAVFVHRHVALRLDVRDVITAKRGVNTGLTSTQEALAGVSVTLGRGRAGARR